MDFTHFLSSHMLDPSVGGKRLYQTVVEQALHAEACGYDGVGIPEHHLVNILLIPSPLQMAVKIAAHTTRLQLMTSICQLPLRDMRVFAGEVVLALRARGLMHVLECGPGKVLASLVRRIDSEMHGMAVHDPAGLAASGTPFSASDNANARAMLDLRDDAIISLNNLPPSTLTDAYSQMIGNMGVLVQSGKTSASISATRVCASCSGVMPPMLAVALRSLRQCWR